MTIAIKNMQNPNGISPHNRMPPNLSNLPRSRRLFGYSCDKYTPLRYDVERANYPSCGDFFAVWSCGETDKSIAIDNTAPKISAESQKTCFGYKGLIRDYSVTNEVFTHLRGGYSDNRIIASIHHSPANHSWLISPCLYGGFSFNEFFERFNMPPIIRREGYLNYVAFNFGSAFHNAAIRHKKANPVSRFGDICGVSEGVMVDWRAGVPASPHGKTAASEVVFNSSGVYSESFGNRPDGLT